MKRDKKQQDSTFVNDIRAIIENGRQLAYAAAGQAAIATYWNVGRRIVEEEQSGQARAETMAREFKHSGIEWIGEIPKEWRVELVGNNIIVSGNRSPLSVCSALPLNAKADTFRNIIAKGGLADEASQL